MDEFLHMVAGWRFGDRGMSLDVSKKGSAWFKVNKMGPLRYDKVSFTFIHDRSRFTMINESPTAAPALLCT